MKIYKHKSEFGFEGDGGLGERLIRQILAREKTATCSFKIEYTGPELAELYTTKGELVTVIDHHGEPRCNIRILDVFETTFGHPDSRLIQGEGYGEDVRRFQAVHAAVWAETVKDVPLTSGAVLVVEFPREVFDLPAELIIGGCLW